MEPLRLDEVSGGTSHQSRREALMRFGRYAAVAPTVMVLLQPRVSFAGNGKGKAKAKGRGRGGGRGRPGHHGPY